MRKFIFICITILFSQSLVAQEIIPLPITAMDKSVTWDKKESIVYTDSWETEIIANVNTPTMEVFKANPELNTGTAVVICPGGGLYALAINKEGNDVAKWLADRGITAFVLKYRLVPTTLEATKQLQEDGAEVIVKAKKVLPMSVSDALNAIDYVRKNSSKYDIDPQRIGLMGFSAGGAVTMGVTYNYEKHNRPDFIVPVYAWMVIVSETSPPDDAPPAFIVCASDDPLDLAPASVQIYSDWLGAKKSASLLMYAKGGHGFGMNTQNLPSDNWIQRFQEWLLGQEFLEK